MSTFVTKKSKPQKSDDVNATATRSIDTWFGWYTNYSETFAAVEPFIDKISR